MLVVDASVATKWFVIESDSSAALEVPRLPLKLVAPSLVKYEVASVFYRLLRDGEISPEDASGYRDRWLQAIRTNVVSLERDDRDIIRGGEIAEQLNHLLADCIYLAMAERLAVPLVTADEKFAKKARKQFDSLLTISESLQLAA